MKRPVITATGFLLCCFFAFPVFADSVMVRAQASGQLLGSISASSAGTSTGSFNVSTGFSLAAEGLWKALPFLQIGAGLEYQLGRNVISSGASGTFQFVPLYAVLRVPLDIRPFSPYVIGRVGYGILSADSAFTLGGSPGGGLYYAAGGGIDVRFGIFSFFTEAAYAADNGSLSISGVTVDLTYSRLQVSAGLSVSF